MEECFEKTKKPPIKVKWVDRNKGDRQHKNVRSRLVAKEINAGLFAATPPLEALRMLLSATVTGDKPQGIDLQRHEPSVHVRADIQRHIRRTVQGGQEPGDQCNCGKFTKSMYGTRAAADWQAKVTRTMTDLVFKLSPCVFWHRQRDIMALIHGDDFVSSGERAELKWLCSGLKKKFERKMIMVGEDDDTAKEARV